MRKKKPAGRPYRRTRTWIPNDGAGGLNITKLHGMMRIDKWKDGYYEFRYIFTMHVDAGWDKTEPYERLDGGEQWDTFGQAKQEAEKWVRKYNVPYIEWVEVSPDHPLAVSTDIT